MGYLSQTVVVIAGILATLDKAGWENAAERLSTVVSGVENCTNVLELSYGHLPDFLKPCLLYFGAFSEDQEISVQRLMELWIAEGFVEKNGQKSQEEMAEEYTMTLISRSLIMVAKRSSTGGVKSCRIHDLLHEFCVTKTKEENFVQWVRGFNELCNFDVPHNLRRVCVNTRQEQFANSKLFGPRRRSLLFIDDGSADRCEVVTKLAFVSCLKLLRVLDMKQILLIDFPSEITMLFQLRYLSVAGNISGIPPSFSNLSNLGTFWVSTGDSAFFLPDTIWTMQNLRCLLVTGIAYVEFAIDDLLSANMLLNLDTLSRPVLYLGEGLEKVLRKFPNIRKLKCCLVEEPSNSIRESQKIVEMSFLSRLYSLRLYLERLLHLDQTEFHFPSNLKKLTLGAVSSSILSTVGKLESLEVLKLVSLGRGGIKMWEMEEGDFPQLKFLKLNADIERWIGSGEHLPCLEKLILTRCDYMEELPSCLECISTLESIEVHYCPESVISLVQDIEEEQVNSGNEVLKIVILREEEGAPGYSAAFSDEEDDEEEKEEEEDEY